MKKLTAALTALAVALIPVTAYADVVFIPRSQRRDAWLFGIITLLIIGAVIAFIRRKRK